MEWLVNIILGMCIIFILAFIKEEPKAMMGLVGFLALSAFVGWGFAELVNLWNG
jgi:hypothetical protein